MRTLQDVVDSRCDVRVWCLACGRGAVLDGADILALFELKGWAIDAVAARRYFPCKGCGTAADVILVAASRAADPEPREVTWAGYVHLWFFKQQADRKARSKPADAPMRVPAPAPQRTYDDALAEQLVDRRRRTRWPVPRLVRFNPDRPVFVSARWRALRDDAGRAAAAGAVPKE